MNINLLVLLSAILLTSCAKVSYQKFCAPELTYTFTDKISFTVMDMENKVLFETIVKEELRPSIGFTIKLSDTPQSMRDKVTEIQSDKVRLLGPVIRYQSPMFAISKSNQLYFYVDIGGQSLWLSSWELSIFPIDHPTKANRDNQSQLESIKLDKFSHDISLSCMENST